MNKAETATLLAILKVAYPQFYNNHSKDEMLSAVNLWAEMFREDDFQLVSAAVKTYIASADSKFPPSIGQIKDKISKITNPDEMTEIEAWSIVKKSLSNGYYSSKEEFAKFPPIIQRLVGSHNQLKEWAVMETSEIDTVVASNFMRSYKARAKHFKEIESMPADVKRFVANICKQIPEEPNSLKLLSEHEEVEK